MRDYRFSATNAFVVALLLLTGLLTSSTAMADWGIYQSYIIVDDGAGNAYYAGGINSDNATAFNGLSLGTFAQGASLTLNGGELKTWKNGNSNVCGGMIFYRVYASGSASGDYSGVALNYAEELDGGNQRWDATSAGIDVASGLSAGDYVLDVWWQAEGNQHGGCGQFQYDSNNGANFQATFTICPSGLRDDGTCLTDALSLQGIIDFTVPSGGNDGKAIHVFANEDISDLSVFGLGVANNGGGSDGIEYTFPQMAVSAGDDILVARSASAMEDYFDACYGEFEHVLAANGNIGQNGDDAIELFESSTVIGTFGNLNVDGTGEDWEYTDSWAYKVDGAWTYGGVNCTDGTATIYDSNCLYPLCPAGVAGCMDSSACNYDSSATTSDDSCTYATTWYADDDGDGLGDAGDSQASCTQPTGYVADSSDNCTDTTACNYDDSNNGSCESLDVCGVCGGSGIPAGDCDCNGNELDALGVCGGSCTADADNDGICDSSDNCTDTTACNYDDSNNGSCESLDVCGVCGGSGIPAGDCDCNGNELDALGVCGGSCTADADNDGICDSSDNCTDTTACNYDDSNNGSCESLDVCGVCGGSGIPAGDCDCNGNELDALGVCGGSCTADFDSDGVCDADEVVGCQDDTACNYNANATDAGSCTYPDTGYDCSGACLNDTDSDGVCDQFEVAGCQDSTACNYNASATDSNGTCTYAVSGYDCDGNCLTDVDQDGICDSSDNCTDTTACNYDDSNNGSCESLDVCGVCGGSGIPAGDCDCNGNELDALGVCGGSCAADADNDGICDSSDNCTDTSACNYNNSNNGSCESLDALGVCGGSCAADADSDDVCDDVDDCVGAPDALGVCNGLCIADADGDGVCDDVDDCVGTPDALGVCNGSCAADADSDGVCDSPPPPSTFDFVTISFGSSDNEMHMTQHFQLALDSLHSINGSPAPPSLMDFLDSQIIGNEVYLEYDLQSVIDSINAVLSNTPD